VQELGSVALDGQSPRQTKRTLPQKKKESMRNTMKSLGIIAEFNPFHQGHQYLIEKAMKDTESDVCIAVMSGNFVQRGTPAVFDKWSRAESAVKSGVNLVVELPTVFACNSAEFFAEGGVGILEGFGCIDTIAFGSESGDLAALQKMAVFLSDNDQALHSRISELTKQGHSYPKARQIAALELDADFDEELIKSPNNILAVEYLKQLKSITPYTLKRRGYGYHQSATMIRDEMREEMPEKFQRIDRSYWELVGAKILQTSSKRLEEVFSAGEGLGNKLKNEIRYVSSTEQLIERMKSKVYTYSRISRLLTHILLDIDEKAVLESAKYIRILALDDIGAKFLKEVKKRECAKLPILTNINKELKDYPQIQPTLEKDILASDMYNIITRNDLYDYSDYIMKPYIEI